MNARALAAVQSEVRRALDHAAKAGHELEDDQLEKGRPMDDDVERYVDTAYKLLGQAQEILELLYDGSARSIAKLHKEYPHRLTDEYRQRVDTVRRK